MVVVNGNFKIDSAVQILAKSSMMSHKSSALPVDQYDHVHTPPVPAELQGEQSNKGAKYEIYSSKRQTSDNSTSGGHSQHAEHPEPAQSPLTKTHRTAIQDTKPPPPHKISRETKCPVCGMYIARYAKWHAQILFSDGGYRAFDGCKDMSKYLFEMAKYEKKYKSDDISAIYVKDFSNGKWIPAKDANFVIDSKILGPMGKEFVPFGDHGQAMKYAAAGGGHVVEYSQINPAMVQSATMMTTDKMHK
jgi:nitrous oxide reductase accessory protein NosL